MPVPLRFRSAHHSARRLHIEPLESRRLLDAAGWFGAVIHDNNGDLFAVDLLGDLSLRYLGQMDTVMFDVAFSPTGELYGVGGPLQGPSELYKINVDLENPGAGIDTTFVGIVNTGGYGVYANGLEFRGDGELFAVGYDASYNGFVFHVDAETADAEGVVYLGGYQSAGDLAFDTDGNMYVTTFLGDLLRVYPDLSGVGVSGWTGFGDFYGVTLGPAPIMYGFRNWTNDVYRINPLNGTSTWIATLEDGRLWGILGASTLAGAPKNLGPVDFMELPDAQPTLGELWYRVEAVRDGILTVDLPGIEAESGVGLALYTQDAAGDLYEMASGPSRVDYEAAAGDRYFVRVTGAASDVDVRVTNLLVPGEDEAVVYGTDGDDSFEFAVVSTVDAPEGALFRLTINGVSYDFEGPSEPSSTFSVEFDGGEGDDVALMSGSAGDDVGTLEPGASEMAGPGYFVEVFNTRQAAFEGGGGSDSATLFGSDAADSGRFWPGTAELSGTDYTLSAIGVGLIEVDALEGDDAAIITGDDRSETVELWPDYAEFGGADFLVHARSFESVAAGSGGGADELVLHDSSGHDRLEASPEIASLTGPGFSLSGEQYADVFVYANHGGIDIAELYDSPGNDQFIATPVYARLHGDGYSLQAEFFDGVHAYATEGVDEAQLYDSPGDDTLEASPEDAALHGKGFYNRAKHFDAVHAYATAGGTDTAELHDSPGNDRLVTTPVYAALFGEGFYNRARFFEEVSAYADQGGADMAKMFDSPGNDRFVATPGYGRLYGAGFSSQARGFRSVHAYATAGGVDVAKLYDSPQDDIFHATPQQGALYRPGDYYNRAKHFEVVHAFATAGGNDVARLFDSPGNDIFAASPEAGALFGTGFYNRAKFFEEVYADAGAGGHDEARLRDSAGVDLLEAGASWARLSNAALDFLYEAGAFDYVKATATTPGDTKDVPDLALLSFTLELEGPWQDVY